MKSPLTPSVAPNWYVGKKFREVEYFGSLSRLSEGDVFLTHDRKTIVTRLCGKLVARHNRCLHRGSPILTGNTGLQAKGEAQQCPVHLWRYSKESGDLTHAPGFTVCGTQTLAMPTQTMWGGMLLGMDAGESEALSRLGNRFGIHHSALSLENYVYAGETMSPVPYARALMVDNYKDGTHVPFRHEGTFATVADCETYEWEFGPDDTPVSYSIQMVRARKNVQREVARVLAKLNRGSATTIEGALQPEKTLDDLGWARFYLWAEEHLSGVDGPLPRDAFAMWELIYPFIMREFYYGGLGLALSHLISMDGSERVHRTVTFRGEISGRDICLPEVAWNLYNPVEFYVHKSVPESFRGSFATHMMYGYGQSAGEDDQICETLFPMHERMPPLAGFIHDQYEAGDEHLVNWFRRNERL